MRCSSLREWVRSRRRYFSSRPTSSHLFFFLNDPATPEIYPLPLHDALPISKIARRRRFHGLFCHYIRPFHSRHCPVRSIYYPFVEPRFALRRHRLARGFRPHKFHLRSEEHTSELQSPCNLVCRLLLEKKKQH